MTGILICCTCHFQSSSLYLASVCRSLQCLISTLTQGGGGGLLFRLTCSVVLRGGRGAADKCHWRAWGVLTVSRPHWLCPCSGRVCSPSLHCSGSRSLCREQALRCVHFPGLSQSGSGSRVVHEGADSAGPAFLCPSQVQTAQVTRCLASAVFSGSQCIFSHPWSWPLRSPGGSRQAHLWCAVCLFWGAELWW